MGNAGHDNTYFARELDGAIERRDLKAIRLAAASVYKLSLATKVEILAIIHDDRPDLYDRAAGRFLRDYTAEREPTLAEIGELVDWLDPIMFARDRLLELADPRRSAT
jgi:hypothetical protein